MITTLGVRTALSILGFFFGAYGGSIAGLVFSSIFAVIGFFFVAWCLARIGEAQGTRKVFGISMVRTSVLFLPARYAHILNSCRADGTSTSFSFLVR